MIHRCTRPNARAWANYGGRGITVCDRWLDFDDYYADTGDCPGPGLSLDRIDNDGDYAPDNVRWATGSEQRKNQRASAELKTHCPANHPYDTTNTYIGPKGERHCRACHREVARRSRERIA